MAHPRYQVQIGVSVTFKQTNKKSGKINTYKFLIATDREADVKKSNLSNGSPLGEALLGMHENEAKTISLPAGEFDILVTAIEKE